ncbi:MAG TPA: hypothetical protein VH062_04665 [Polyangiaceae bacterium]|jgi:hypothetical protein|nr:hypothetical protein [Polyangiaceae bacterium]
MNGRALGLLDAESIESREKEATGPRAVDDDVRKAWAVALAASIPAAPIARPGFGEASGSTGAWRPSDVSMTEMDEEVARAGQRPAGADSEPALAVASRLETVVNTGALGRVSFVVDRSNDGLSIVVEVASDAAAAAVDVERMTLLRTLRVAGLTVLSFRVLVRGGSGTPLAQKTGSQHAKGVSTGRARYGREPLEEDDPENVDVIV